MKNTLLIIRAVDLGKKIWRWKPRTAVCPKCHLLATIQSTSGVCDKRLADWVARRAATA